MPTLSKPQHHSKPSSNYKTWSAPTPKNST